METPETEKTLKLGRRVGRGLAGYIEIAPGDALARPCVVVFGGTETTDNGKANSLAKRVDFMLARQQPADDSVAMYAVTYPRDGEQNNGAIRHYNDLKSRRLTQEYYNRVGKKYYTPPEEARHFVRDYLLPLIARDPHVSDRGEISGAPLPVEEAKRNLRNITMVGHSYGAQVIEQIGDALAAAMFQLRYPDDQAKSLTRQVAVLSVGDVSAVELPKNAHFTTLHTMNEGDSVMAEHAWSNNTLARSLLRAVKLEAKLTAANSVVTTSDRVILANDIPVKDPSPVPELPSLAVSRVPSTEADVDNRWIAVAREIIPMKRAMRDDEKLQPDFNAHEFETNVMLGSPEVPKHLDLSLKEDNSRLYSNAWMLPTAAASFLRNAVDNSVRNHNNAGFTLLPDMPGMLKCPDTVTFATSPGAWPYTNLPSLAKAIGYDERLDAVTLSDAQRQSAVTAGRGR